VHVCAYECRKDAMDMRGGGEYANEECARGGEGERVREEER